MAARIQMQMGEYPAKSYIEVSGFAAVTPKEVIGAQMPVKHMNPGYNIQFLDSSLKLRPLKLKAGTTGEISIELTVFYEYWETPSGFFDLPIPLPKTGTVHCGATWQYQCTKQGEISLRMYFARPSPPDDFAIILHDPQSNPPLNGKLVSGEPFVMLVSEPLHVGSSGTSGLGINIGPVGVNLPGSPGTSRASGSLSIFAELTIVDKEVTPSPPPPPPIKAHHVRYTCYFENEKQTTFDQNKEPQHKLQALFDWVKTLEKEAPYLYEAIKRKHVTINVTGYASPTGSLEENDRVSQARAEYVATKLGNRIGSEHVKLNKLALASDAARKQPGVKPGQYNRVYLPHRRVDLDIDEQKAKEGMALVIRSGWSPP
jgi:hypothetical protein